MKSTKVLVAIVFLLFVAVVLSMTAFNQVEIDRDITATVLSDVDADVAVRFELLNHEPEGFDYTVLGNVVDGKITINLEGMLNVDSGFNPDALFVIGTTAQPVLKITNNTSVSIDVNVAATPEGTIKMYDLEDFEANPSTIAASGSESYYFEINTPQSTDNLTAVLEVRKSS